MLGSRKPIIGLLVLVLAFLSFPAFASDHARPFWTEQAMFRFGEDLFFIGQASCANSPEEGRQKAFLHGLQELLNYGQGERTARTPIETQMIYEERHAPECPPGTVSVWRLLKVQATEPTEPIRRPGYGRSLSHHRQVASLTTLWIGMSRDDVFDRLGRPSSITLHQNRGLTWEYRRAGLLVEFDNEFVVQGWNPIRTAPRTFTVEDIRTSRLELLPTR